MVAVGKHRPGRHSSGLYSNNFLHDLNALLCPSIDVCLVSLSDESFDLL
jgi:hypothetical protein